MNTKTYGRQKTISFPTIKALYKNLTHDPEYNESGSRERDPPDRTELVLYRVPATARDVTAD